jgi:hypothetical protein
MDFYLSHLPEEVTEDYLRNIFDHLGSVRSVRFVPERTSIHSTVLAIIKIDTLYAHRYKEIDL